MNEPTLAEIIKDLREEADGWEDLVRHLGAVPDANSQKYPTLMRAAADRLEGLAKLAGAVDYSGGDVTIENVELEGKLLNWLKARERLLK